MHLRASVITWTYQHDQVACQWPLDETLLSLILQELDEIKATVEEYKEKYEKAMKDIEGLKDMKPGDLDPSALPGGAPKVF